MKKKLAAWAAALTAMIFLLGLLVFPAAVREAVGASAVYCLTGLAPTLFPFLAAAAYVDRSGLGELLGRLLRLPTRRLFRLPGCCASVLLMSLIGGYPAGARGVSLLLERGAVTREQAGRLLLFCINPGPAFVVSFVGLGLLGSLRLGWLLFAAVSVASLLLGLLSAIGRPLPEEPSPVPVALSGGGALVSSVRDACQSTLMLCGCVCLFSGMTSILHGSGLFQLLCQLLSAPRLLTAPQCAALLSFVWEVTGGAGAAAAFSVGPVLYAFGLAFAGLCVHLQVFSFFPDFPGSRGRFFAFRLLHALLAAGLTRLGLAFLPAEALQTFAAAGTVQGAALFSGTATGGLSLLLMCAAFLLALGKAGPGLAQRDKM